MFISTVRFETIISNRQKKLQTANKMQKIQNMWRVNRGYSINSNFHSFLFLFMVSVAIISLVEGFFFLIVSDVNQYYKTDFFFEERENLYLNVESWMSVILCFSFYSQFNLNRRKFRMSNVLMKYNILIQFLFTILSFTFLINIKYYNCES